MERNWSPHILLVQMSNSVATLENNVAIPQMLNIELTTSPGKSTSNYFQRVLKKKSILKQLLYIVITSNNNKHQTILDSGYKYRNFNGMYSIISFNF